MYKKPIFRSQDKEMKNKLSLNLNNMHSEDKADLFFDLIIKLRELCDSDVESFKNVFLYDNYVDEILNINKGILKEFKEEYKLDNTLLYIIYNIVVGCGKFGVASPIEKKLNERYIKFNKKRENIRI